jgi:hypothetical protein
MCEGFRALLELPRGLQGYPLALPAEVIKNLGPDVAPVNADLARGQTAIKARLLNPGNRHVKNLGYVVSVKQTVGGSAIRGWYID